MLGLVLSLFGFLVAVALTWIGVFLAVRFRGRARRYRAASEDASSTPEQLVDSWTRSS